MKQGNFSSQYFYQHHKSLLDLSSLLNEFWLTYIMDKMLLGLTRVCQNWHGKKQSWYHSMSSLSFAIVSAKTTYKAWVVTETYKIGTSVRRSSLSAFGRSTCWQWRIGPYFHHSFFPPCFFPFSLRRDLLIEKECSDQKTYLAKVA